MLSRSLLGKKGRKGEENTGREDNHGGEEEMGAQRCSSACISRDSWRETLI